MSNIYNIQNACISRKRVNGCTTYLCRILGFKDYGITLTPAKVDYVYINTLFYDEPNHIDNWITNSDNHQLKTNEVINIIKKQ